MRLHHGNNGKQMEPQTAKSKRSPDRLKKTNQKKLRKDVSGFCFAQIRNSRTYNIFQ